MREENLNSPEALRQRLLLDMKWQRLLRLAKWFRFAPFVDFVLAGGSMALGNVHSESDFDVLVGVREGRMFTARYSLNLIFSLLRGRRLDDFQNSSPDKLCFNHFVTPATYSKPPYNDYRKRLYSNLIPIYGNPIKIDLFFRANTWSGVNPENNLMDLRFENRKANIMIAIIEKTLNNWLGNIIEEKIAEPIARHRLSHYLARKTDNGRVVISEKELEFHFSLPYEK